MTPRTSLPLIGAGLALAAGAPALAQTAEPPISQLVVTTTRLPTSLADVPGAKVVDRAEIERRDAVFAGDVLATVPGVAVSRNGPFGGVTSLQLRGAPSDKTLVLVDGVPVNDPSQPAGSFDFSSLDLADVNRIEVLSGPQGSLWGSDAIGGVVNILTREPQGLRASAELGSYKSRRFTAAAGVAGDKGAFGVSASSFDTDGISKADARDGNTERDPFHTLTAGASARLNPAAGVKLEARIRWNRAKTHYDGFGGRTGVIDSPDTSDAESASGLIRATIAGPFGFTHALSFDASGIDRRYDGAFPFSAEGGRTDWRWLATQDPARSLALALGAEHQGAHEDTGDGRQTSENNAVFGILRWTPNARASAGVSLRRDEPRDFKGRTTARVDGRLGLDHGFALAASWGQGFKVPSLFEATYPCFECAAPGPNRSLRPERADGWDATLAWVEPRGRADASVTVYRLSIRDRIDYRYPRGYVNVARTRSNGAEAKARVALGAGVSLRASYAWTDSKDSLSGAALRVPRHAGNLGLDWAGGPAQLAVLVRAQSGAPDSFGRLKGFTVVEASGGWRLSNRVRLTARVENLLDRHYQQAFGYGEPGRSAYAGIAVSY